MGKDRDPDQHSGDERISAHLEVDVPKISLEELSLDVSAFLHFLSEHFESGEHLSEVPSFWMLIPKSLDVEWREGTDGFFLEKEVFSRKILIVAPPVPLEERQGRRAELLMLFHNAIAEDQVKQILLLLSRLKQVSRHAIAEKFLEFKAAHKSSNVKDG